MMSCQKKSPWRKIPGSSFSEVKQTLLFCFNAAEEFFIKMAHYNLHQWIEHCHSNSALKLKSTKMAGFQGGHTNTLDKWRACDLLLDLSHGDL